MGAAFAMGLYERVLDTPANQTAPYTNDPLVYIAEGIIG